MTEEQKWFNALLISVKSAWPTCNIEVLSPGLFTLHPLRLIARKLAILILTQQNVIMDTTLGCHYTAKRDYGYNSRMSFRDKNKVFP